MQARKLDSRLPLLQQANLKDKVVLVRFDHNVVKKGQIKDPYRIDRTIGTLFYIVAQGGRPILTTHVGRPYDKKTGTITTDEDSSIAPIVDYLESKLHCRFLIPGFAPNGDQGIPTIFYPSIIHERREQTQADNDYNCPMVVSYPEVIRVNMDLLDTTGTSFLNPFLP